VELGAPPRLGRTLRPQEGWAERKAVEEPLETGELVERVHPAILTSKGRMDLWGQLTRLEGKADTVAVRTLAGAGRGRLPRVLPEQPGTPMVAGVAERAGLEPPQTAGLAAQALWW